MKRGKWVVYGITVLLILAAIIIGKSDLANRNFPFSVKIVSHGQSHEIPCYESWGEYYVFLPAYAEQAQVTIRANPIYDIYIEDQLLTEGMSRDIFPLNQRLELFFDTPGGEPDGAVTFLQSRDVGTVYIDVPSGSMEYIHEQKGNKEGGYIQVYDAGGTLWHGGNLESIRGRGNATWLWDKKPYSITTAGSADIVIELSTSQGYELVREVMAADGVCSVSLLSHDGEVTF